VCVWTWDLVGSEESERFDAKAKIRAIGNRSSDSAGGCHPKVVDAGIGALKCSTSGFTLFERGDECWRESSECHAGLVEQQVAVGIAHIGNPGGHQSGEGSSKCGSNATGVEGSCWPAHRTDRGGTGWKVALTDLSNPSSKNCFELDSVQRFEKSSGDHKRRPLRGQTDDEHVGPSIFDYPQGRNGHSALRGEAFGEIGESGFERTTHGNGANAAQHISFDPGGERTNTQHSENNRDDNAQY
jgi:hypothetical protein